MEGSPEPASKPKRVNYGKRSLVLQNDAMRGPDDHRQGDIPRNPADHGNLQRAEEHIHDLVEAIVLPKKNQWDRREDNTIHVGKDLVYPDSGQFGTNPNDEVGLQVKKIERLVDYIFHVLIEKLVRMKPLLGARMPFGQITINDLKNIFTDGEWSDTQYDYTWKCTMGNFDNRALKIFRLSLDCNTDNPDDSRLIFLKRLLYRLDRKLRHYLYSASGNHYPVVECLPGVKYHGDDAVHTQFHPVFRYEFDDKSGFTVSLTPYARTVRDPEPGTAMYFRSHGYSETLQFIHNGKKMEIDVKPFLQEQVHAQQQDFMMA